MPRDPQCRTLADVAAFLDYRIAQAKRWLATAPMGLDTARAKQTLSTLRSVRRMVPKVKA